MKPEHKADKVHFSTCLMLNFKWKVKFTAVHKPLCVVLTHLSLSLLGFQWCRNSKLIYSVELPFKIRDFAVHICEDDQMLTVMASSSLFTAFNSYCHYRFTSHGHFFPKPFLSPVVHPNSVGWTWSKIKTCQRPNVGKLWVWQNILK